jgi:hypothetical protein
MPWFKLDDGFYDNPKVARAGNAAIGLWVRCATYSARHLTDGYIDTAVARTYGTPREIERCLDSQMWIQNGTGLIMPDYLEYNPSAEQVRAERAKARDRMARRRHDNTGQFD